MLFLSVLMILVLIAIGSAFKASANQMALAEVGFSLVGLIAAAVAIWISSEWPAAIVLVVVWATFLRWGIQDLSEAKKELAKEAKKKLSSKMR
jgi:hypothetical protein